MHTVNFSKTSVFQHHNSLDIGLWRSTHTSPEAYSRKDRATQRDRERERCVMMVRDKALRYNADMQASLHHRALIVQLCEVFVLKD